MFVIIELLGKDLGLFSAITISEKLIDFLDQVLVSSDVVKKSLGNEYTSVVFALIRSLLYQVAHSTYDVDQGFSAMGGLLRDNDQVRVSLHRALEHQVGGVAAHQANEIPILDGRGRIRKHVTDKLRIDLRGCVEADGGRNEAVADVSIYSSRDTDNTSGNAVR